jgi:hypothetical protein
MNEQPLTPVRVATEAGPLRSDRSHHPLQHELLLLRRAHDVAAAYRLRSVRIDPGAAAQASRAFPRIGVSLDTLDAALAERIGRVQLPRVLRNLERLIEHMGSRRVELYTVNFGQPLVESRCPARSSRMCASINRSMRCARSSPREMFLDVARGARS